MEYFYTEWILFPPLCVTCGEMRQKQRQQKGAGPAHIWMKNIWAPSLFLCVHERLSADTGGWRPKHQHTDWPGAPEFHRLTLPEDDGSVLDDLDRDPRPPDCLWVLPDFWAVSFFSSELEGRAEGMTERGDVLFWKSYSDPLSWLKWLYSTWRNTHVLSSESGRFMQQYKLQQRYQIYVA